MESLNKLIINSCFFGKDNCFKCTLNSNKECYLHWGIKKDNKYAWIKAKFGLAEIGLIVRVLNGRKNTASFFHSFNDKKAQFWINNKDEFVFFRAKANTLDISKSLNEGEQEVLAVLLRDVIVRMNS